MELCGLYTQGYREGIYTELVLRALDHVISHLLRDVKQDGLKLSWRISFHIQPYANKLIN